MKNQGGVSLESLARLSDEVLVSEVKRVSRTHRAVTAELIAHLAEMDARKLYRSEATPSMFVYCVARLGFSEDEACRRIDAARLARKWPVILQKIANGELSLSVVGRLKPLLTDENATALLEAVSGKSVRDAERILASRFPRQDVADSIRKLPEPRTMGCGASSSTSANLVESDSVEANPLAASREAANATEGAGTLSPDADGGNLGTTRAPSELRPLEILPAETKRPAHRGRIEPLAEDRMLVKFTASRALAEKLELARDLMSHANPRGDLAAIVETAIDLLIQDRMKKKLGQTQRKQRKLRAAKPQHVRNETRRAVLERDGLGCNFVNDKGERCGARAFLELDHREPKGKGGSSEAPNVRMLCRAHNQLEAERAYGTEHMEKCRSERKPSKVRERVRAPGFVTGFGASGCTTRGATGERESMWAGLDRVAPTVG
jgi:hypothetical protein